MSAELADATGVARVFVTRSAVHEGIARVPAGTICAVMAPAGYGKSVLAREWGPLIDQPCVVVAVHETPRADLERALVGALTELSTADGSPAHESSALEATDLAATDLAETDPAWDESAPHPEQTSLPLAEALERLEFDRAVLVVNAADRLHAPADRELVRILASTPREGLTVVVTGRSMPVGLSGAHSSRRLVVLDTEDLALTRMDIATAYRDRLTSAEVDEVLRLSGGWPMAMRYALATVDPTNGEAAHERRLLTAYLREQVYDLLDPRVQDFRAIGLKVCLVEGCFGRSARVFVSQSFRWGYDCGRWWTSGHVCSMRGPVEAQRYDRCRSDPVALHSLRGFGDQVPSGPGPSGRVQRVPRVAAGPAQPGRRQWRVSAVVPAQERLVLERRT